MSSTAPDDASDPQHAFWGVFRLAAANYSAFDDEIDKVAAEYATDHTDLRDALAELVDSPRPQADLDDVAAQYEIGTHVLTEAAARCARAFKRQYPDL